MQTMNALTIIACVSDAVFLLQQKKDFGCHQHRFYLKGENKGVAKIATKFFQFKNADLCEWHMFMQNILPEIDLPLQILIRNYHKFSMFIICSETLWVCHIICSNCNKLSINRWLSCQFHTFTISCVALISNSHVIS